MRNIQSIIDRCILDHNIDPRVIYCRETGKPIGMIFADELALSIQQCEGDEESLADELWTRCMTAMRPSPAWNVKRADSLRLILNSNPCDLLAYLMNRLYDPIDHAPTLDTRFGILANHVKMYARLQEVTFPAESLDELLLVLLEIDTRYGLRNTQRPTELLKIDWLLTHTHSIVGLIRELNDWLDSLTKRETAMIRKAQDTAKMVSHGNRLTRTSLVETLNRVKPSKARVERTAKIKERNLFDDILDSLCEDGDFDSVVKVPAPAPVVAPQVRRIRFGVKS